MTEPTTAAHPVPADPAHHDHVGTAVASLTPDTVNAIIRNPEDPRYPTILGVFCDTCSAVIEGAFIVTDAVSKPQRLEIVRTHARSHGWSCTGEGDHCPACIAALAAEPVPAETAHKLRDRLARALAEITVGHRAFVTVDVEAEYPRADAVLAVLPAPAAEVEQLRALVADLADDDPCQYDHKDQCQTHSLHYAPCPHSRAKRLLAGQAANRTTEPPYPPSVTWEIQRRRTADTWAPWSGKRDDRDEAHQDYAESVAHDGGKAAYRLVRSTATYAVEAEHTPAEQAADRTAEQP